MLPVHPACPAEEKCQPRGLFDGGEINVEESDEEESMRFGDTRTVRKPVKSITLEIIQIIANRLAYPSFQKIWDLARSQGYKDRTDKKKVIEFCRNTLSRLKKLPFRHSRHGGVDGTYLHDWSCIDTFFAPNKEFCTLHIINMHRYAPSPVRRTRSPPYRGGPLPPQYGGER